MPRYYKRRRRFYRRRPFRRRRRRYGRRRVTRRNYRTTYRNRGLALPNKMFTKFRYVRYQALEINSTITTRVTIRANSAYDPHSELGNYAAFGWNRVAQNWKSTYCYKTKTTFIIIPRGDLALPITAHCFASSIINELDGKDLSTLVGRPFMKTRVLSPIAGSARYPVKMSITTRTRDFWNINNETMDRLSSTHDALPEELYFHSLMLRMPSLFQSNPQVDVYSFTTFYYLLKDKALYPEP